MTFNINGRTALPLRAIPYVTFKNETPESIVRILASPKKSQFKIGDEAPSEINELFAYQMGNQGDWTIVQTAQWKSVLEDIVRLRQSNERENTDGENISFSLIQMVLELPSNSFLWLDEFQSWYTLTRPILPHKEEMPREKFEDTYRGRLGRNWELDKKLEREKIAANEKDEEDKDFEREDDTLCLTPFLPPEIENKLWRYSDKYPLNSTNHTNSKRKVGEERSGRIDELTNEITKAAKTQNIKIDLNNMPGTRKDLHELAQAINIKKYSCAPSTFNDWLKGKVKFKRGSRSSDFYKKLFPHLFKLR